MKTAKYPISMIILHNFMALIMIATWLIAQMEDFDDYIDLHRSLGFAVLLLVTLRIINRLSTSSKIPTSVNVKGSIKYILEKSTHGLLYLTMLALPIIGCLLTNAQGDAVSVFGLFELPRLMSENFSIAVTLSGLHELAADIFVILLALHIVGALVHLIKNKENVFKRMLPW